MEKNMTIQNQLNEIFEKYHANIKNFGSSSKNKYFINDSLETDFDNITNFIQTIFFKDSGTTEKYETTLSSLFGRLLVKYCESGLDHNDIKAVLEIIKNYNETIEQMFNTSSLENQGSGSDTIIVSQFMKYIYGLYVDSDSHVAALKGNTYINDLIDNVQKIYVARTELHEGATTISNGTELQNKVDKIPSIISYLLLIHVYFMITASSGITIQDNELKKTGLIDSNICSSQQYGQEFIKLVDFITNGNELAIENGIEISQGNTIQINNVERSINSSNNVIKQDNETVFIKYTSDSNLTLDNENETEITLSTFKFCDYFLDPMGTGRIIKLPKKIYAFRLFTELEKATARPEDGKYVITAPDMRIFTKKVTYNDNNEIISTEKKLLDNVYIGIVEMDAGLDQSPILSNISSETTLSGLNGAIKAALYPNLSENIINIISNNYYDSEYDLLGITKSMTRIHSITDYIDIRRLTMEILYDFATPTSGLETYVATDAILNNINKNRYPINIKLLNIELDNTDETDRSIKELVEYLITKKGLNVSDYLVRKDDNIANTDIYKFSICVLYKEFNDYYRSISNADDHEKLFASYYKTNKKLDYYDLDDEYSIWTDVVTLNDEKTKILKSTYSNPYNCRIASKYDIISYRYGEIINYGLNETEKNEIEKFVSIYKETRDYFYKIQFNKAFALDEMYDVYCLMYIITFSIDRWFISKIRTIQDVRYYNLEDCKNFFESYGMEEIGNIIDKKKYNGEIVASFFNELEYCKKIVGNYTELSKYKGSKKVIDILSDVFQDDINSLTVTKYMIFHDLGRDSIRFVNIPYSSSNSISAINDNIENGEDYYLVTTKDKYWNGPESSFDERNIKLPEDILIESSPSLQPTKYLGLSIATDISEFYFRTRYSISLMEYLSKNFYSSSTDAETNIENRMYDIMSKISVQMKLTDNSLSDTTVNIVTLFEITHSLYKQYMYAYTKSLDTNRQMNTQTTEHEKFYGINMNATIDTFIDNLKASDYLRNILNAERRENAIELLREFYQNRYMYTDSEHKKSVEYFRTTVEDTSNLASEIEQSNGGYYVFPLKDGTPIEQDNDFMQLFQEYAENSDTLNFIFQITEILDSINLLTIMNKENASIMEDNADPSEIYSGRIKDAFEYFNALHMFEKYRTSSKYPAESDIKSTENGTIGLSAIYNTVLGKLLSFPNDYLTGKYQMKGISSEESNVYLYNHNVREFLTVLFETFFLTEEDVGLTLGQTIDYRYNPSSSIPTTDASRQLHQLFHLVNDIGNHQNSDVIFNFTFGDLYENDTNLHKMERKTPQTTNEYKEIADNIFEKLGVCIDSLNTILSGFTNMGVYYGIEENKNEMLNFVAELVKIFISYTTSIYSISSSHVYDSNGEAVPFTDDFTDELENKYEDDLYYDEGIEVKVDARSEE